MGKEKKEGFLQRWSRRKILDVKLDEESGFSNLPETEVIGDINNEKEENKSKIRSETESETVGEMETSLEGLSDEEVLEKLKLPDPEKMKSGDDFKGFLSKGVPEHLRNRALRKLWVSNPILANLDGMNEYDDDFTLATSALEKFATNYVVGKGFKGQYSPEEDSIIESEMAESNLKSSSLRISDATPGKPQDQRADEKNVDKVNENDHLSQDRTNDSVQQMSNLKKENSEEVQLSGQSLGHESEPENSSVSGDQMDENKVDRIKPKKMVFKG